ncbi:MAG: hypothetical protein JWL81_2965 [Verrucomicrobiales bacterium]|nr:hypothetical protein [Verrucomicrobiales bacterium]
MERIISDISKAIDGCEPKNLSVTEEGILFKGGIFRFVGNWNQLAYIGSGQISFSRKEDIILIHYRISFMQWFIISGIMAVFFFFATASVATTLLVWLFIFLGNSGYAFYRFPRFLLAAVSGDQTDRVHQ